MNRLNISTMTNKSPKVLCRWAMALSIMSIMSLSAGGQQAELIASPELSEVSVDDTLEVTVNVNPAGQPLAVADVHLRYDPDYLEVLEVEALADNGYNVLPALIDNISGVLSINAFQLGDQTVFPAFPLVKITMKALAETQSTIVNHPQDVFPRTILAFAGEELSTYAPPFEVVINSAEVLSTIDEKVDGLSLSVWPNPTKGLSNAEFSIEKGGSATLEIFDVSGVALKRIFHGTTPSQTRQVFEFDMESMADGIYFLRLMTEHGTIVRRIALTK